MPVRTAIRRVGVRVALIALVGAGASAVVSAQLFNRSARSDRFATPEDFDGKFHFCRLAYQGNSRGRGGSSRTDYPDADINMSIRLSELTKTSVSFSGSRAPNHLLVQPADDELFGCPMVMMMAPGSAWFSDEDAARLREYLMKGGFIWADDFWGTFQWEEWESQIRLVLPESEYAILDLPMTHPLLRAQFIVTEIPQVPNIRYYFNSGGDTSEQGADSAVPRARMILDEAGRMMVFMTHNTDIADSWEREGEDERYFLAFSPRGYALGINVFLYAMTH
jgi:hypothetical protein